MAKSSSDSQHALDFLATPDGPIPSLVAVFGDDAFLRREVLTELRRRAAGTGDAEFSFLEIDAARAQWRDVAVELDTPSLFGGDRRVVVLDDIDAFLATSKEPAEEKETGKKSPRERKLTNRERLEDYAAKPSSATILIVVADSWPSNTRLFKAFASGGINIDCTAPKADRLAKWLIGRAKDLHSAKLQSDAAEALIELIGPEAGLVDAELGKLAAAAGAGPITCELVQKLVGSWRTQTAWEMIDEMLLGNGAAAIGQIDRLIAAGEHPIAITAMAAPALRRFAAATRLLDECEAAGRRPNGRQILQEAGFKPFVLEKAEKQWKQLGRRRAGSLYQRLLEIDLALKGRSSAPARARLMLERLAAELSVAADPRGGK